MSNQLPEQAQLPPWATDAAWRILDALGYPYNRDDRPEVADWHRADMAGLLARIINEAASRRPTSEELRSRIEQAIERASYSNNKDGSVTFQLNELCDALVSELAASTRPAEGGQALTIYADSWCARCSELSRPLKLALAEQGVPTGEDNWQQTYGPAIVRRLADSDTLLRRLLIALDGGKKDDIDEAITLAKMRLEFHRKVSQKLTIEAQKRHREREELAAATSSTPRPERCTETKDGAHCIVREPQPHKHIFGEVCDHRNDHSCPRPERCENHCGHHAMWFKDDVCLYPAGGDRGYAVACGHRCVLSPVEQPQNKAMARKEKQG